MNYLSISRVLQEYVPEISVILIKQCVNVRYQQILKMHSWSFLKDSAVIGIADEYDTGTIAVASGGTAVTGSGTTFTAAMVGRSIYLNGETQPYIIATYTSATSIALASAYAGASALSGDSYSIKDIQITPAVDDVVQILDLVHDAALDEVPLTYLNKSDPTRTATGSPAKFALIKKSSQSSNVTVEVNPVQTAEAFITMNYVKKASDLSSDSDEPVVDAELLIAGSLWDLYRLISIKNPAFVGLARDAYQDFMGLLQVYIDRDIQQTGTPVKSEETLVGAMHKRPSFQGYTRMTEQER